MYIYSYTKPNKCSMSIILATNQYQINFLRTHQDYKAHRDCYPDYSKLFTENLLYNENSYC